jgi:hypothetical protein
MTISGACRTRGSVSGYHGLFATKRVLASQAEFGFGSSTSFARSPRLVRSILNCGCNGAAPRMAVSYTSGNRTGRVVTKVDFARSPGSPFRDHGATPKLDGRAKLGHDDAAGDQQV